MATRRCWCGGRVPQQSVQGRAGQAERMQMNGCVPRTGQRRLQQVGVQAGHVHVALAQCKDPRVTTVLRAGLFLFMKRHCSAVQLSAGLARFRAACLT